MSQTKMRDRIFAGLGAVLFLVTASAFTIMVIWDGLQNRSQTSDTANSSTVSCEIDGSVSSTEILPVPEAYTTSDVVTDLKTEDLEVGTGVTAKAGDCLQMKYYGTLASAGTMFDENYTKSNLLQFKLGAGQVIKGWDQGLVGIKEGGTRRVVIPASLGYGAQAQGSIPANSDLVFVVKLVKIKK